MVGGGRPEPENLDEHRTVYLFYAPDKDSSGWHLELPAFAETFQASFPEARCVPLPPHPARLSFWAVRADGVQFSGFADNETRHTILLEDATPSEAAQFLLWLRDTVLPAPGLLRFSTEEAVERDIQIEWRLPAIGGVEQLEEELQHHLRVVAGQEGITG